jgi:hypothetical protein
MPTCTEFARLCLIPGVLRQGEIYYAEGVGGASGSIR